MDEKAKVKLKYIQKKPPSIDIHWHPVIPDGQISEISSGTTGYPEQRKERESLHYLKKGEGLSQFL